ncbi:unnamed protein product [Owenia fusiformis]|uniref:Uncharacterized protein n=1 Tax=Owenia fusiformis TaxID=6347 RepID=A0A8J1UXC7_OWEFU|nr:unnamed protein product [Owenia fusiformis]
MGYQASRFLILNILPLLVCVELITASFILPLTPTETSDHSPADQDKCRNFHQRRSCQYRCCFPPQTHRDQYFYCNCDDLCVKYGDCCHDYETIGCNPDYNSTRDIITKTTSCKMISKALGVYVESVCPEKNLVNNSTIQSCENPGDDILDITPVMDNQNGLHYANIYCAMCNGIQNVTFWQSKVYCTENGGNVSCDNLKESINKNLLWDIVTTNSHCSVNFTLNDQDYDQHAPPRPCFKPAKNYLEACDIHPLVKLADDCRNVIYEPVFANISNEAVMLPNLICALCLSTEETGPECVHLLDKDVVGDSLNVIFSYELEITLEKPDEVVYQHKQITKGAQRFDAFAEVCPIGGDGCQVVSCPTYYIKHGDRCIFNEDVVELSISLTTGLLNDQILGGHSTVELDMQPFTVVALNNLFKDIPVFGQPKSGMSSGCSLIPSENRPEEKACKYFFTIDVKVMKALNNSQKALLMDAYAKQLQRSMEAISWGYFTLNYTVKRKIMPSKSLVLNVPSGTNISESFEVQITTVSGPNQMNEPRNKIWRMINGTVGDAVKLVNDTRNKIAISNSSKTSGVFRLILGMFVFFLIISEFGD